MNMMVIGLTIMVLIIRNLVIIIVLKVRRCRRRRVLEMMMGVLKVQLWLLLCIMQVRMRL